MSSDKPDDGQRHRAGSGCAAAAGGRLTVADHTAWTACRRRAPYLDLLARHAEVIAPSSPGFGHSPRPEDFDTVYDLVHLYLALLDDLPGDKIDVVGLSFGGWLAAEIAAASCHRINRLVLADPVGIKIGGREERDILDVFNTHPDEVKKRSWHDPAKAPDYDAMTDDELIVHARNWESLCLYGWHPYMFNPQLKQWLPAVSTRRRWCCGARKRRGAVDAGLRAAPMPA